MLTTPIGTNVPGSSGPTPRESSRKMPVQPPPVQGRSRARALGHPVGHPVRHRASKVSGLPPVSPNRAASPRTYQFPDASPAVMIDCVAWVEKLGSERGAVILGRHSKPGPVRAPSRERGQYCSIIDEDSYAVLSRGRLPVRPRRPLTLASRAPRGISCDAPKSQPTSSVTNSHGRDGSAFSSGEPSSCGTRTNVRLGRTLAGDNGEHERCVNLRDARGRPQAPADRKSGLWHFAGLSVLSFTMFFVPLLAATVLVQLSLCRKSEPLPTGRVVTILRGCRIALAAMAIELLSAWVSVAVGANRSHSGRLRRRSSSPS